MRLERLCIYHWQEGGEIAKGITGLPSALNHLDQLVLGGERSFWLPIVRPVLSSCQLTVVVKTSLPDRGTKIASSSTMATSLQRPPICRSVALRTELVGVIPAKMVVFFIASAVY
jgi:hypothetical protein